ncbi:MAG TPA: hypothetical protein VF708_19900 [Pyrinomonadaceae bacterium]|jgi:hypothetical protein
MTTKPIQSSSLLINEDPLQVLPTLAGLIGLNEAIVLQQVHFWLRKSKNVVDDRKWTYDTYEEWQQKNFPFWSVKTVQRVFLSLEAQKLLISMQPEKRDRRKWYTIDYDLLEEKAKGTHTPPRSAPSSQDLPTGQSDLLHDDNLPLSDATTCPLASGQSDLLGEDNLSSPSGQPDPLYIKDSENSSENSGDLTHTEAAAPARANGNGRQACVCATPHRSNLCDDERIRIASTMEGVHNPERYAMTIDARRGTYDAVFLKCQKELQKPGTPSTPERDTSACPDCQGSGFKPSTLGNGVAKCSHPRLEEALERFYDQAQKELRSSGQGQ